MQQIPNRSIILHAGTPTFIQTRNLTFTPQSAISKQSPSKTPLITNELTEIINPRMHAPMLTQHNTEQQVFLDFQLGGPSRISATNPSDKHKMLKTPTAKDEEDVDETLSPVEALVLQLVDEGLLGWTWRRFWRWWIVEGTDAVGDMAGQARNGWAKSVYVDLKTQVARLVYRQAERTL